MYAIAFDFDTEMLERLYPNPSWRNAHADVRDYLLENGFEHRQGSVYFGEPHVTAVDCVAVVQDMASEFSWFTPAIRDIRMLRIEENNDLMVALDRSRRRGGRGAAAF
ncbi:MAG TPA: virulence factor [Methylomirabilota bacterium]|nr:virulence factor [Methylomirabilota bacterium]